MFITCDNSVRSVYNFKIYLQKKIFVHVKYIANLHILEYNLSVTSTVKWKLKASITIWGWPKTLTVKEKRPIYSNITFYLTTVWSKSKVTLSGLKANGAVFNLYHLETVFIDTKEGFYCTCLISFYL